MIEAARSIVQDEFDQTYWSMDAEDGTQADRDIAVNCASLDTDTKMTLYTDLCTTQVNKYV